MAAGDAAVQLRGAMAGRLGCRSAAMLAVPRHLFLPGCSLEEAYSAGPVVTRRDAEGVAVSSASAPGVVAGMLEQLDVRPGQQILEIGAGTGYNAALLGFLAGPAGHVTSLELDPEVAAEAAANLRAASAGNVAVICGDGEHGWAGGAPYDRIIVTAGAWDLPPAWAAQLAPDGRLVVPLRMRGITRSIAFTREDGCWRGQSMTELGFMPMRGIGAVPERNLRLGRHGDIILRVDDGQAADAQALSAAVDQPGTVAWTGLSLPAAGTGDLDFWLAGPGGLARLMVTGPAAARGFTAPVYNWGSMAVIDGKTLAYLTERPTAAAGLGTGPAELGVCACGPGAARLAARLADRVLAWDRERQLLSRVWVEAHPAGGSTAGVGDLMVVGKRHTRVIVRASPAPGAAAEGPGSPT
jgi:protein-L-isoaspartate(D-aspartate) O-methyltransferase